MPTLYEVSGEMRMMLSYIAVNATKELHYEFVQLFSNQTLAHMEKVIFTTFDV